MRLLAKRIMIVIPVIIVLIFSACEDNSVTNDRYTASESFEYTFELDNNNRLRMNTINSVIFITGEDGSQEISVIGERRVTSDDLQDAEEQLQFLELDVHDLTNMIFIEVNQPSDTVGREYEVDFEIRVPSDFVLDISNVNGYVDIDSLDNDIDLSLINGQVSFDDLNGSCFVDIINGEFDGNINLPLNGVIEIEVINGLIDLDIPQNTSAQFTATVLNGEIAISNINMTNQQIGENQVSGTIGDGQGTITLDVENGNIEVFGY